VLRRPPRVEHVVVVLRVVLEPRPALGAQTRAVVPAHRCERQIEHHRVAQHRLEVEEVPDHPGLVVVVFIGRARQDGAAA
jgi:hypothetical protein